MGNPDYVSDKARILQIIDTMFESISWAEGSPPDFEKFGAAIRRDAILVPDVRPAAPTDIGAFIARMSDLHSTGALKSIEEKAAKTVVNIFGNMAVALGGYHAVIEGAASRGANAFLLIREADDWQIAAMAWGYETPDVQLTEDLA